MSGVQGHSVNSHHGSMLIRIVGCQGCSDGGLENHATCPNAEEEPLVVPNQPSKCMTGGLGVRVSK